jgi:hypothetical protein
VIGVIESLYPIEPGPASAAQYVMIAITSMSAGRRCRCIERSNRLNGQLLFLALQYNLRLMKLMSATQFVGGLDGRKVQPTETK